MLTLPRRVTQSPADQRQPGSAHSALDRRDGAGRATPGLHLASSQAAVRAAARVCVQREPVTFRQHRRCRGKGQVEPPFTIPRWCRIKAKFQKQIKPLPLVNRFLENPAKQRSTPTDMLQMFQGASFFIYMAAAQQAEDPELESVFRSCSHCRESGGTIGKVPANNR